MSQAPSDSYLTEPPLLPHDAVEAFALNGDFPTEAAWASSGTLRGVRILERKTLPPDAAELARALLHNRLCYGGEGARCFLPRHGFRFASATTQVEVLICFECDWIYFYYGPRRVIAALSEAGRKTLEKIFQTAGLPISPRREPFVGNGALTLAQIVGPWVEPEHDSGLIARCRAAWGKQIGTLNRAELATLLRQKVAVTYLAPVAWLKLAEADDGTEFSEGELAAALQEAERV